MVTNFKGSAEQISELLKNIVEEEQIDWHFNLLPLRNLADLWEAGVKAVKTHITRVIGTFEAFYTLLLNLYVKLQEIFYLWLRKILVQISIILC